MPRTLLTSKVLQIYHNYKLKKKKDKKTTKKQNVCNRLVLFAFQEFMIHKFNKNCKYAYKNKT